MRVERARLSGGAAVVAAPVETLILSAGDVAACLEGEAVLSCVERTLRALAGGAAESGPRAFMAVGSGAFLALPAVLREERIAGMKWVSTLGDNPARGLPKVRGAVLLSDADTGALRAVLDAKAITAWRTAALAVVAAKYCGVAEPGAAAVVGFGTVGRTAAALLSRVLPLREIRVFGRRRAQAEATAAALPRRAGVRIRVADSVREAVTGAGVVVTATGLTADEPLVDRAWIGAGAVVCGLGSYQEIDTALITDADRLVVDSWEGSSHRGQFAPLVAAGRLRREDIYAELSEIVAGGKPGRASDREIVVASLLGRGVFDVAVAAEVLDAAQRRGIGRPVAIDTW